MDKQEMVRCPSVDCLDDVCKHNGEHKYENRCMSNPCCHVCVPAEPAQPELPRENPYTHEKDTYADGHRCGAFCRACAFEEDKECFKERIAELEAVAIDGCQKGNPCLWLARIAQLEAKLDEVSYKYKDTFKQLDESMAITYALEQQLAQAEIRAEVATGAYNTIYEREASLKEQLAVFTKDIPKGRFCYMANSIYCEHESGGDCVLLQEALVWDKNKDAYLKAPGCPVPAKEEQ